LGRKGFLLFSSAEKKKGKGRCLIPNRVEGDTRKRGKGESFLIMFFAQARKRKEYSTGKVLKEQKKDLFSLF